MMVPLIIAGLTWRCIAPEGVINESILSFSEEFSGNEDIHVDIRFSNSFMIPPGDSITRDVLEWYEYEEGRFAYNLIKRDEETGEILVSMKVDKHWSDVLIEIKYNCAVAIEITNILCLEIAFRNRLHFHDGIVVHSSAIEFEGEAILFAAPSGTGKTTHVSLWQKEYNIKVINDDHPAIRIIEGRPIVFGTPWAGEENKYHHKSCALKGIVVLEQGKQNSIRILSNAEIVREFFPRCFLPYFCPDMLMKAIDTINQAIDSINVFKLVCTPEREAVQLVKNNVWPSQ